MIDTHTHLGFKAFEKDWQEVVERSASKGVEQMIVVGTEHASNLRAIELGEADERLFATVGVHPHHVKALINPENLTVDEAQFIACVDQVRELSQHERVVAIGEIGLDYYAYKSGRYELAHSDETWEVIKKVQGDLLREQVRIAVAGDLPIIVHSREAKRDVLAVLSGVAGPVRGVFHCFDGSIKYLKQILAAGMFVSFTGNVTYSQDRMHVACQVPLDRLLLETDCPYMAPSSYRGERCEPWHVGLIAQAHAKAREISVEEVVAVTTRNAQELFGIE